MSLAAHPQALCGCSFSGEAAAFFSVITESSIVLSMFSSLPLVKISISFTLIPAFIGEAGGGMSTLGQFLVWREAKVVPSCVTANVSLRILLEGIQRDCHRVPKARSAKRRLIGSSLQLVYPLSVRRPRTTTGQFLGGGGHDIKALPFCGG